MLSYVKTRIVWVVWLGVNASFQRAPSNVTRSLCSAVRAAASAYFNLLYLESSLTSVVWIYRIFENNFGIKHDFHKKLKESCWFRFFEHFSLKYISEYASVRKISPNLVGIFGDGFRNETDRKTPLDLEAKLKESPHLFISTFTKMSFYKYLYKDVFL